MKLEMMFVLPCFQYVKERWAFRTSTSLSVTTLCVNSDLTLQSCTLYRVEKLFLFGILEAAFSKAGCKCNVLFGFCNKVVRNIL